MFFCFSYIPAFQIEPYQFYKCVDSNEDNNFLYMEKQSRLVPADSLSDFQVCS